MIVKILNWTMILLKLAIKLHRRELSLVSMEKSDMSCYLWMKEEPATGLQNGIAGSLGTLIKKVPSSLQTGLNNKFFNPKLFKFGK